MVNLILCFLLDTKIIPFTEHLTATDPLQTQAAVGYLLRQNPLPNTQIGVSEVLRQHEMNGVEMARR